MLNIFKKKKEPNFLSQTSSISTNPIVEACLKYFQIEKIDYAIMISGKWGSGKTYFWKNDIIPELNKNKTKFYYVSLYGVKTTDELEKLFLTAQYPFLKHGITQIIGKITSTGLKAFQIDADLKGLQANMKNCVICFDDLERADLTAIPYLLGYINNLVEHEGVHVLILCDEKIILSNEKITEDYGKYKEKLIGYTYEFEPSTHAIVETFINSLKAEIGLHEHLIKNKSQVLHLIEISNLKNLRTLYRVQFYILHIYNAYCLSEVKSDEAMLNKLFALTFSLTTELKNNLQNRGYLESIFISDYDDWYLSIIKDNPKYTYLRSFSAKYFSNNLNHLSQFYSVFKFIDSGILDLDDFKQNYLNYLHKTSLKSLSSEEKFFGDFTTLTESEFKAVYKKLILDVESNRTKSSTELLRLLNRIFFMIEANLIQDNPEEISKIFETSIDHLQSINALQYEDVSQHTHSLFMSESKNGNYLRVKSKILKFNESTKTNDFKNKIIAAFNKLSYDFDQGLSELYGDGNSTYVTTPIFDHLDVGVASKIIINLNHHDIIRLKDFLISRYEQSSNINEYLFHENEFISKLKDNLSHITISDDEPLKKFGLASLIDSLSKVSVILKLPK